MHKLGENWAEHTEAPKDHVRPKTTKRAGLYSPLHLRLFLAGFVLGALVMGLLK